MKVKRLPSCRTVGVACHARTNFVTPSERLPAARQNPFWQGKEGAFGPPFIVYSVFFALDGGFDLTWATLFFSFVLGPA
jgi:hypothetical protein